MDEQEDHDAQRGLVAGHVQAGIEAVEPGALVTKFVLCAVIIQPNGETEFSSWTSPDQRQWDTLGLIDFLRGDHYAYLASLRVDGNA